jgi:hypothetical protein
VAGAFSSGVVPVEIALSLCGSSETSSERFQWGQTKKN